MSFQTNSSYEESGEFVNEYLVKCPGWAESQAPYLIRIRNEMNPATTSINGVIVFHYEPDCYMCNLENDSPVSQRVRIVIGVCIDTYVIYQGFFSEIDELSIVNHKFVIHLQFTLMYMIHTWLESGDPKLSSGVLFVAIG